MRAFDPRAVGGWECRAAELEVEWWRAHRDAQHPERGGSQHRLVEALADLYSCTYGQEKERRLLIRSYAALLAAVHR